MSFLLAFAVAVAADLVDVKKLEPRFVLDIKYATTDNFTKRQLYPVARCLLRPEVAEMLLRAQRWLDSHHPGHVFMLKDCYRPEHLQRVMWEVVAGTPQQGYVANPGSKTGSVHNYGAAVDLTLVHDSAELDMGTPYDYFGKLAEPRHEEQLVRDGKLLREHVDNRKMLRDAMVLGGGFLPLTHEWWHFDALRGAALRRKYSKLDIPLEAVP